MTKKEKEQMAKLKATNQGLRRQLKYDDAYWRQRATELRDESNTYLKQRDCIYSKKHKAVFDCISVESTRVRILYECPFCGFRTQRVTADLCEEQQHVLTELGIVPKGGE